MFRAVFCILEVLNKLFLTLSYCLIHITVDITVAKPLL